MPAAEGGRREVEKRPMSLGTVGEQVSPSTSIYEAQAARSDGLQGVLIALTKSTGELKGKRLLPLWQRLGPRVQPSSDLTDPVTN